MSNQFTYPRYNNIKFAEFVGVVLGDGCITKPQVKISLNRVADKYYIESVVNLIKELFSYEPHLIKRKSACVVDIVITGVDFVTFLTKSGLEIGNKVKQQVDVPNWIKKDLTLSKACVRGLVDTDGCIYINRYRVNGKWYQYRKVDFTNHSQPLLHFVHETLQKLEFHPTYHLKRSVRLSSEKETLKYLEIIGSSNSRLETLNY